MAKKDTPTSTGLGTKLFVAAFLLVSLLIVSSIAAILIAGDDDFSSANTALIRITGPITSDASAGLFDDSTASSSEIVRELEEARDNDAIKAVILEINSPGGSAVASDEIAQAVKDLRAQDKIVVAWIREVGASGAYWVASSSDHIVAHRMSITGSIGVIGSYVEFAEFLDEWNLTYQRFVAGERKDIGDPLRELNAAQRAYLQGKLDRIHDFFITEVANNRDMSEAKVRALADGSIYLGVEALEYGLVDELGGEKEAIAYIEKVTNTTVEIVEYGPESSFFEELLGVMTINQPMRVQDFVQRQATREEFIPMLR